MYKFVHFIYSKSILKVKKQEMRNKVFIKEGICPVCDGWFSVNLSRAVHIGAKPSEIELKSLIFPKSVWLRIIYMFFY